MGWVAEGSGISSRLVSILRRMNTAPVQPQLLVALGKFVEQLIGGPRLLSVLVLSALGGSLASMLSSPAASVGASGALWGLFGTAGALTFWPRGIIPTILIPRLKRSVIINLGINLLISFAPQIDLAAHLGGGIVGGALAGSGILLWGHSPPQGGAKLQTLLAHQTNIRGAKLQTLLAHQKSHQSNVRANTHRP